MKEVGEWVMGFSGTRAVQAEEQSWGKGPKAGECLRGARKTRRAMCAAEPWREDSGPGDTEGLEPQGHGQDLIHLSVWWRYVVHTL